MNRDAAYEEAQWQVKINHFTRKGYDINGVMHVGTNDGYEFQFYRRMGIEYFAGFEPLPLAIEAFRKNYPKLVSGKEFFFPFALGNEVGKKQLFQTTGDGQGSSFLDPTEEYKAQHPEYTYIATPTVKIVPFAELMYSMKALGEVGADTYLPIDKFDCLVVDTQGTELEVMKGMREFLDGFKYLNIECSEKPVYAGGAAGQQIVDFLAEHNFVQDSPMEIHNDVFFIRKDVKHD